MTGLTGLVALAIALFGFGVAAFIIDTFTV